MKFVIVVLVTLGLTGGCATAPGDPDTRPPSIVIDNRSIDTRALLAEQAYLGDNRLYIQFRHHTDTINSYAVLPVSPATATTGASDEKKLQQLIEQYNHLPLVPMSYLDPQQWIEHTHDLPVLPVAGVALWREFRDRLLAGVTPRKQGRGIVVEFLKRDELFYYYDAQGLLSSVPVHEKPADYRVMRTIRFSKLLSDAAPLLREYALTPTGKQASAVVFNTGDTADYGYPFIFASRESSQVFFLRRLPESDLCCGPSGSMLPGALAHTTASHVGGLVMQPVGSISRLFSLVSFKIVDLATPKPVFFLTDQPIPPVSGEEPMDPEQWDLELNALAYSPLSQGTIEYLVDGAAFFPRLIDAIHTAEDSIDVRLYIFDNDDYALKIADLLKQRSKQIKVRVLIDGLGTIAASAVHSATMPEDYRPPSSIRHYLETDSNVSVRPVLNPWLAGDHTKTILIDGRTAFIGGMNIGREYRYDWHDLMVELHGPVVDEIQTHFEKAWRQQSFLGDIRAALYRPGKPVNEPQPDDIPIKLLLTKPGDSQILRAQLAAIGRARQRIYIENAYFTSDDIIFELAMARRRGVDVRVIIPYASDSGIINRSNVRAINAMLKHGIRVYIYPGPSHVKGAVYDGWVCLGSANFDELSLRMNKELNIATSNPAAVQSFLSQVIMPDFAKSVELKEPLPERWSDFLLETIADQL